ncbi:MAG: MDR family oxidoreductase [Gammaproteobacteria bacterium]|nr:MDR family oxidoreductase [Gammaproteobacteria bacterium]
MRNTIKAIVAEETPDGVRGKLQDLGTDQLPAEDVLVDVAYSTINYKDALAVTGKGKICRSFPMVCGIDLAGTVTESSAGDFEPGDKVLANGWGLGEKYWGGLTQQQRLRPEWLVRAPESLSLEQCMAVGTAGYTSMLCIQALQDHGIRPESGPVVVTGATGGVGSIAVMLLARLGYQVAAVTGKADAVAFLTELGANEILPRDELDRRARPLESERWAGAIDSVGSKTLATVLVQTKHSGCVAACGLAGGFDLPSTVMPFILRGVTLAGIDSVLAPQEKRQRAWNALAELINLDKLDQIYSVEPLARVPELAEELIAGRVTGRIVIDVNA